jgi:shikimate kinase
VKASAASSPACWTASPKVIATGGGAVVTAETRDGLVRGAFTVWLRKDVEAIIQRLSTGKQTARS